MAITNEKPPFCVTKSGSKVDKVDDFLPRGRSLRLIAETLSPNSFDVQQTFFLHPYPVELRLSRGEGFRFRREFHICRWLDLLEQMGLRGAIDPVSDRQEKAAKAIIELLRVIDWRRKQGKEFHFELAQASAYLLELNEGGRQNESA